MAFDLSVYSAIPRWQAFIAEQSAALPPLLSEQDLDNLGDFGSLWSRWRWRRRGEFPEPVLLSTRNLYVRDSVLAWMISRILDAEAKAERRAAARAASRPAKVA